MLAVGKFMATHTARTMVATEREAAMSARAEFVKEAETTCARCLSVVPWRESQQVGVFLRVCNDCWAIIEGTQQ